MRKVNSRITRKRNSHSPNVSRTQARRYPYSEVGEDDNVRCN